jgi:hypothetical protein
MAWPVLVFDIESIPDIAGLRALRSADPAMTDAQVYASWVDERKEKGQNDFMPLHLQRILVISAVFRNADGLRIHSFVDKDGQSEGKVIQTFFNTVGADLHLALDVLLDVPAQVTLDLQVLVDVAPELADLFVGQVPHPAARVDPGVGADLGGEGVADAEDVGEGDDGPLLARDVDAGYSGHSVTPAAACVVGWCR